jgi:superfamily II DNA or RNA helicase
MVPETAPNTISFKSGSLIVESPSAELLSESVIGLVYDDRTKQWRTHAYKYRILIEFLIKIQKSYVDLGRSYQKTSWQMLREIQPREHQREAFAQWQAANFMGTVSIPTGGGKTILAVMVIHFAKRSTLIVVPTIDLMHQWYEVLTANLSSEVGLLGGGYHEVKDLTVATYDSAYLHVERIGNRFGLLVFDECHHLPGDRYKQIALSSIAPLRLGLSATVERTDGKEQLIFDLVGPLVYEGDIRSMIGHGGLSPYNVVTVEVPLTKEEQSEYQEQRKVYTDFLHSNRINLSSDRGWSEFLIAASRSESGREAMKAYLRQKKLAHSSQNKLKALWEIFQKHGGERIIVFTNDNDLAYHIGRLFYLAVLTHKTKVKERKKILSMFREGGISIIVTSKVLNEGVDVPEASIGIVVSGSGAIREHVQRLGRILRGKKGKVATLYELIAKDTAEYHVNRRRREHNAYQRPTSL